MRYRCIHRRRSQYPVRMMCRVLTVSSSGYYAWCTRAQSQRERDDRELTRVIRRVHAQSDGTYGSPRLHLELKAAGYRCGRAKVARLMRQAGLKGCPKRRFRVTGGRGTGGKLPVYETLYPSTPGVSGCGLRLGGADGLCRANG